MAEDKKKDGDAKAQEGAKKKGLPAIVLIALGAIVGGAGVVFAVPPKTVEKKVAEPPREDVDVEHPDKLTFKFNPQTGTGSAFANVSFYFVYTLKHITAAEEKKKEETAYDQIKTNMTRARSNVLMMLKARTKSDLQSESGRRVLTADLIKELNASLFPGEHGKHFVVSDVLWEDWMVQ
ncbi:MAG: flagellar basal body-associated FliL family protein [Planctomycetes bacterium]|nr:flagellar basal body-associated FliL family protein [Planctomycetota bacterium]